MAWVDIEDVGQYGINMDIGKNKLPLNVWTDCNNIRFLGGSIFQAYGYSGIFGAPSVTPYHLLPVVVDNKEYWVYAGANKIYGVSIVNTEPVHTNLTRQDTSEEPAEGEEYPDKDYDAQINSWTSCTLNGTPVLNAGNETDYPQVWSREAGDRFIDLPNWPQNTYCKSLRVFKNHLIALNVTLPLEEPGEGEGVALTHVPNLVKWSHPASMGFIPHSWAIDDPAMDSGEMALAEDDGEIVDGLALGDYFVIYRKSSIWVMAYVGGDQIFSFKRALGSVGAMNRNCVVEHHGYHFVFGESDIFVHNGYEPASVLDNVLRRKLFHHMIDTHAKHKCFVFKNPFFNEVYACFPETGSETCNKAVVWNYVDKTVSLRDIPNLTHAAFGPIDSTWGAIWDAMKEPWDALLFSWNAFAYATMSSRVLIASENNSIYILDSTASIDGNLPVSFIERRGMSLGDPRNVMFVRGVRIIGEGNTGETVSVRVGGQTDPFLNPIWTDPVPCVIGHTVQCDLRIKGRYIALRIDSGSAYQWRIDKIMIDAIPAGRW